MNGLPGENTEPKLFVPSSHPSPPQQSQDRKRTGKLPVARKNSVSAGKRGHWEAPGNIPGKPIASADYVTLGGFLKARMLTCEG